MAGGDHILKRDYQEWLEFCKQVQNTTGIAFNESKSDQAKRKLKALSDYNFFFKTYFPLYADCDCGYFQIESATKIKKNKNIFAVLEWAREHGKSVHADVGIPLWLLASGELTGMILMGKNGDDAANLLSDIQAQLQFNQLYIHDFGEQYNSGSWEVGDFSTRSGIRFLSLGRDQSPRGARKNEKRPNYAVIDDIDDDILVNNPARVREIVGRILGALYFALSIKGSRLVVAGNRIHHNSVLAHLVGDVKPGQPKRAGIYHSKVYATEKSPGVKAYIDEGGQPAWKERYTLDELRIKIRTAGMIVAKREFYHESIIEGTIFKADHIRFKKLPPLSKYTVLIGYFDPSFENKVTSDYKAIKVWGLYNDERHCISAFVRRTELISCFIWMGDFEKSLPPGVGIIWYVEKQFFNRPVQEALVQAQKITGRQIMVITDPRIKENKYVRMVKMEPRYSQGKVFYNIDKSHDPDMLESIEQLKGIEPGYKSPDDSPDADEGAWFYIDQHTPGYNFKPIIGTKPVKSHY